MKKIIVILLLLVANRLFAQTLEQEAFNIIKIIERNTSIVDDSTSTLHTFYVYEINFDSTGAIDHIAILRGDESGQIKDAKRVAALIKQKWVPVKLAMQTMIVPVFVINQAIEKETVRDKAVKQSFETYTSLFKGKINTRVYATRPAIIIAYAVQR